MQKYAIALLLSIAEQALLLLLTPRTRPRRCIGAPHGCNKALFPLSYVGMQTETGLTSFEEALRVVLGSVAPLWIERVGLLEAAGRVLAEDIVAPWNMPLCDNSAMDGFAVRAADCVESVRLKITGFLPAGARPDQPVAPGCAIKIMTGAPIPRGSDAVVPIEEVEEAGGEVLIRGAVPRGQHVRVAGEDVVAGEKILSAGAVLHPPAISVLASCGRAHVLVYGRVRVAIVSTGDELVEIGEPIAPGQVVNSNAYSLAAAVREIGGIPVMVGIARDEPAQLREKLAEGFQADVLITSAGVSAGDRDYVRDVLQELGVRQLFWHIAIKPGAPTAFGVKDAKPIFALPGNPVSTMVIFEEMVRPALLKMMGHRKVLKAPVMAILQDAVKKKPGRLHFMRVRLERSRGTLLAYSAGDQNTAIVKTMLRADGLAILPAEAASMAAGTEVAVHLLSPEAEMLESAPNS
jgi:molybdopterin molybdotransferase